MNNIKTGMKVKVVRGRAVKPGVVGFVKQQDGGYSLLAPNKSDDGVWVSTYNLQPAPTAKPNISEYLRRSA